MLEWLLRRRRGSTAPPVEMTLYTRPGCGLCDEMREAIRRTELDAPYVLTAVDIRDDLELERRWGESIPVLEIAGKLAFKGRLTEKDLLRKFRRIVADTP